jgi:Zn-finger nucleic acid-binding protein
MADAEPSPGCPRCGGQLAPLGAGRVCRGCRGAWLPEDRLAEMVRTMHDALFAEELMFTPRLTTEATLTCPGCGATLTTETFANQPVDRCPAGHGVWLDDGELTAALRTVAPA